MFYEVLEERIDHFNFLARLVSSYELWTGKGKHRHVGISIGVCKNMQEMAVLLYDLSCWNSWLSGIGYVTLESKSHCQTKARGGHNCISASDVLFVDIDVTTVDQILQNFQLGSGAYVWNRLPRNVIVYPLLWTILRDHVMFMLHHWRKTVDLPRIDMKIDAANQEAQCAQYVLMLLVFMLKQNSVQGATEKHKNCIYALVFHKTSLHPHTLWEVLVPTKVFFGVPVKCKVTTLQQFTRNQNTRDETRKLTDIILSDPYRTEIALNEILVWEFKYTHLFQSSGTGEGAFPRTIHLF